MYDYYYQDDYFFHTAGMAMTIFLFIFILAVLLFMAARYVAISTMFMKAGEAPWKSLIPVYDMYTFFKLTWDVKMFIPYVCGLAGGLIGTLGVSILSMSYYYYYSTVLNGLFTLLMFCGMILWFVFQIMLYHHISKAYGKDAGYTVGLVFLETIFFMILGFGSSQYIGTGWTKQKPAAEDASLGYVYRDPAQQEMAPQWQESMEEKPEQEGRGTQWSATASPQPQSQPQNRNKPLLDMVPEESSDDAPNEVSGDAEPTEDRE